LNPCPSAGQPFYGQDAQYAGPARFYTKLDAGGNELPDSAPSWAMVRGNVTGLVWEAKQNLDNVQNYVNPNDADNPYTWCDTNPTTNGGDQGYCGLSCNDTEDFLSGLNDSRFGGHSVPKTQWMDRDAWDRSNQGEEFSLTAEGYVEVPAANHPDMIYHFWHTDWPRPAAKTESTCYLKVIAQVSGNAMIQAGFDYYLEADSTGTANLQAAYSDWFCAGPRWQEIIVGVQHGVLPPVSPANMLLLRE
jgi:hypothetical protein